MLQCEAVLVCFNIAFFNVLFSGTALHLLLLDTLPDALAYAADADAEADGNDYQNVVPCSAD